jgi:hypothetical protein
MLHVEQNLAALSLGELDAGDALTSIRAILSKGGGEVEAHVYETLRAATWKLLTARAYGDKVREWHDVLSQLTALAAATAQANLAMRIDVLSDLLSESINFGDANPAEDLMRREHVTDILRAIQALNPRLGTASRGDIKAKTQLKDANLSRILANMVAAGLVERNSFGKQALFALTDLSRKLLNSPPTNVPATRPQLLVDPPLEVCSQ